MTILLFLNEFYYIYQTIYAVLFYVFLVLHTADTESLDGGGNPMPKNMKKCFLKESCVMCPQS